MSEAKHQTPNIKHQIKPKHQTSKVRRAQGLGIWSLELLWSLVFGVWCFTASSAPMKIESPPETEAFKHAPGSEIANGQCLTCHSVEYVGTQPLMPRAFWAGSVKKMQEKYGAQIPQE